MRHLQATILALLLAGPVSAQDLPDRSWWKATASVTAVNLAVWGVDYASGQHWVRVSPSTWKRNLSGRLHWDTNLFITNQLAHPYHGSLYFNGARSNGFGFLGSAAFTAGGSVMWETLLETSLPSANDLMTTTLGGIAIGEVLHRTSLQVWEGGGVVREMVGFVLNPMGGVSRLFSRPSAPSGAAELPGARLDASLGAAAPGMGSVAATLVHGTPDAVDAPFDFFRLRGFVDTDLNARVAITGALAGGGWLKLTQRSEFSRVAGQKLSFQSLGPAAFVRWGPVEGELHLHAAPLASLSADTRRGYDMGPGFAATARVAGTAGPVRLAAEAVHVMAHNVTGDTPLDAGLVNLEALIFERFGVEMLAGRRPVTRVFVNLPVQSLR